MRRLALLTLLVSTAAFAQEKANTLSVFISDPQYAWTSNRGSEFNAGYGAAFQHKFSPRWSGELSVSRRHNSARGYFYDMNGHIVNSVEFHARTTPVDLLAQYHFLNGSSWKPYLGGGMTHIFVNADNGVLERDKTYATVNGGVIWLIKPSFGIRLDGKALFGDRPSYVHGSNASVGLSWRF